jgi:hypothetical protein
MVETLVEHPELAAGVKHYSQSQYPGQGGWWNRPEIFEFWKQLARDLHMDDPEDPEFDHANAEDVSAPKFCEEVLVGLLSKSTESLSLMIEDDANYDGTSFPYLARRFRHLGSPGLPQLRRLRFDTEERYGVYTDNPGALVILRNAPNLEYLEFHSTKGPRLEWEEEDDIYPRLATIFPTFSSLRTLKFTDSAFDGEVCCSLVKSFAETSPLLETFHFVDHSAWLGENEHMVGMGLMLLKALEPRQATLKNLTLDLSHHSGGRYAIGYDESCRILLKAFTNVDTLSIDEQVVCRYCVATRGYPETANSQELPKTCLVESLPESVETVTIKIFFNSHIWEDLKALADGVAQGDFPKLRHIFIIPDYRYGQDNEDVSFSDVRKQAETQVLETKSLFAYTAVTVSVRPSR